jgi:aspartate beta-hydroxylase
VVDDLEARARELVRAKDLAGLKSLLDAAAATGAMTPRLEGWAANLARERGEHDVAIAAYRRVLAQVPDDFPSWFNLGLALESTGDAEGAATAFARSLGRPGGHRDSLFRLGACLDALGRHAATRALYEEAVTRGLLQHPLQRPRHFHPGLRALPVWPTDGLGLEALCATSVLTELRNLVGDARAQTQRGQWRSPALAHGRWEKLFLGHRGRLNDAMDELCPRTMAALRGIPLAGELPEGNICLSIVAPDTELHAHCGPTNVRLRAHLGLEIPPDCGIRIAGVEHAWREGEWLVFDDSFEHMVLNRSKLPRVILIVDLWHPDLSAPEARKHALSVIARATR